MSDRLTWTGMLYLFFKFPVGLVLDGAHNPEALENPGLKSGVFKCVPTTQKGPEKSGPS